MARAKKFCLFWKFFFLILISLSCFFNHSGVVIAQSTSAIDTYTINLSGSVLGTEKALNITISISGGSAQLLKGVTFKANGASQLLTDVDLSANIVSVSWTGAITDGKATVTGKIDSNSVVGNPILTVTKIQGVGGTDLTTTITATVVTSSSTLPLPTPSPSPSPSPTPEAIGASVSINAPDSVNVPGRRRRSGIVDFTIEGSNFASKEICELNTKPADLLILRPKRVKLEGVSDEKDVVGFYSVKKIRRFIKQNNLPRAVDITLDITCPGGAKDSKVVKFKLP